MHKIFNKESKIVVFLIGLIVVIPFLFTLVYSDYTFSASHNPIVSVKAVNNVEVPSVYESINQRLLASVNDEVSDYTIKSCTTINHTDGAKLKFCLVDFKGQTTGFYDSANDQLYVENFDNAILVHELFHAASLHLINKGITDFSTHEAQEMAAYDAEFLYEQIMNFKSDQISAATSKKLMAMYGSKY